VKIAFDARYLNTKTSGVGTYSEKLLRALAQVEPNLEFLLVTRAPGLLDRLPELRGSELVLDAPPRSLRTLHQLPLQLRRHTFDLFHGPFNILPSGLSAPSVVTLHDLMQLQNPENIAKSRFVQQTAGLFWRTRIRHAVKNATRIVTVSRATRDAVFEFFPSTPEQRVVAAPIGVDPYFFAEPGEHELALARERVGSDPFVFTVGNESPHKNHRRAILAFIEAFPAPSPLKFVIVRRLVRHDPELLALLDHPNVKGRVVLLEYTEQPMLRALYRLARVFFFPSWVEGFGIPILEAMAQGTPVVTSDRNALLEVAADAAETVSPFSVQAMAEGLVRIERDEERRTTLVGRGHARAREFTWGRCAEATLSVYEEAIRGGT
jgi:glycosyltransferase involved in cell wall biosynthesis